MEIDTNTLASSLTKLIAKWREQSIEIYPLSRNYILNISNRNKVFLPDDFVQFYCAVNGMQNSYPNNSDDEGFLFYPIEEITLASGEFENSNLFYGKNICIFANYMDSSWWYGFEADDKGYKIGIIPDEERFIAITDSLQEFIELYLDDSEILYNF